MTRICQSRALVVLFLLFSACSSSTPHAAPSPVPAPAASTAASGADGENDEPIEWIRDESGRFYYVKPIERVGPFHFIDKNHVRIHNGLTLELEGFDEKYFYARIYREEPIPVKQTPQVDPAVARAYEMATKTSDSWTPRRIESGLPSQGQWRNGFALGDVNRDGFLDLVSGPPRRATTRIPRIFLGNGKGQFTLLRDISIPQSTFDYGDAEVGDFDGDGLADLAFASHFGPIDVLMGQPDDTFELEKLPAPQGASKAVASFSSRTLLVVDWNGDRRDDLVALSEGPAMPNNQVKAGSYVGGKVLFTREGDGTWRSRTSAFGDASFGDALVAGDFNGDGRIDFASSGASTTDRAIFHFQQADGSWAAGNLVELRDGTIVRSLATLDADSDGRADLAVGYQSFEGELWRSGIDLFLARGTSWERRSLWSELGRAGVFTLAAGDLDGDGRPEIVGATGDGRLVTLKSDRSLTGEFTREPIVAAMSGGCRGYDLEIVDVDGDGVAEIVAEFAGEQCPNGGGFQIWKMTLK